ncbi:sulfite exporter TauE/SafE family protein [Microscilla marina]|uniref:Probable membrane transporter protein n=1 Tax=Microscilla marina ATCC 23134 TaxID=313606 RepID=A1ZXZ0_MICM2|nr:TSUP family transporter [Microscilla marina]EAY24727.1 domain of unknown function, putative [Microscilla marina ATCC 23134]
MIYVFLIIGSILTGFINTLAGSGSLIMLPLLMAAGLPANIANGTNRVATLVQSIVGVGTFVRNKKIDIKDSQLPIGVCVVGAFFGAFIATRTDPAFLKQFIKYLMIVMFFVILVKPKRWFKEADIASNKHKHPLTLVLLFFAGVYAGFIQAGIGIILLAILVLRADFSLPYANFVKLVVVLVYALPVLIIFVADNEVNWKLGGITACGQGLGAFLGARFATRYKNVQIWIYRLLVFVVLSAIIYLFKDDLGRLLGIDLSIKPA